jgi:ubiquinone/menaquinone biosynthesis C-methylase UbiE
MSDGYIHGGTDPREVARLEKQAAWCGPWILERFDAKAGMRVLDLATGVGAMAGELEKRFGGVTLMGVDLSTTQVATAHAKHPGVPFARANGAALPFRDDAFDRVHCSWLLEHLSPETAVAVLREVRRVLKPGGYCHFTEVDNSTFRTQPELPGVMKVIHALNEGQVRGGGDPFIAPRLEGYLRAAGFTRIDARRPAIRGDASDPVFFQGFIDEFAEIFESLDEALGDRPEHAAAAKELRGLIAIPGASMHYQGVIAQAFKA